MTQRCISTLIGDLLDLDQSFPVLVDGIPPAELISYRGFHEDLAIDTYIHTQPIEETTLGEFSDFYGKGHHAVVIKSDPTVADLVKALELALTTSLLGYKGGAFKMTPSTDVWVSGYGDCSSRAVTGVSQFQGTVRIETEERAGW
jgi:hypothetical protein